MKKILLIISTVWMVQAYSASFDCSKASSLSEITICNDIELSKLDDELGEIYKRAKKASKNRTQFKKQSISIWKWREKNCLSRDCLLNWYKQRKISLEKIINNDSEAKYLVILGSYTLKEKGKAYSRLKKLHNDGFTEVEVLSTNDYPNLRKNLFIVGIDGLDKDKAHMLQEMFSKKIPDAYIKNGGRSTINKRGANTKKEIYKGNETDVTTEKSDLKHFHGDRGHYHPLPKIGVAHKHGNGQIGRQIQSRASETTVEDRQLKPKNSALYYPNSYLKTTFKQMSNTISSHSKVKVPLSSAYDVYNKITNKDRKLEYFETENGFIHYSERSKTLPLMQFLDEASSIMEGNRSRICKSSYSDSDCKKAIRNLQFAMLMANRLNAAKSLKNKSAYPQIINEGLVAFHIYKNYQPNKSIILYDGMVKIFNKAIDELNNIEDLSPLARYNSLSSEERVQYFFGALVLGATALTETIRFACKDGGCDTIPNSDLNDKNTNNYTDNKTRYNPKRKQKSKSSSGNYTILETIPYSNGQSVIARIKCNNGTKGNVRYYPNNGASSRFYISSLAGNSVENVAKDYCSR